MSRRGREKIIFQQREQVPKSQVSREYSQLMLGFQLC